MVIEGLRRRGIDVSSSKDAGLIAADDENQLTYAAASGRVLITRDADFLILHGKGTSHAGIAYFRQRTASSQILRMLMLLHGVLTPAEMLGRVEFF